MSVEFYFLVEIETKKKIIEIQGHIISKKTDFNSNLFKIVHIQEYKWLWKKIREQNG